MSKWGSSLAPIRNPFPCFSLDWSRVQDLRWLTRVRWTLSTRLSRSFSQLPRLFLGCIMLAPLLSGFRLGLATGRRWRNKIRGRLEHSFPSLQPCSLPAVAPFPFLSISSCWVAIFCGPCWWVFNDSGDSFFPLFFSPEVGRSLDRTLSPAQTCIHSLS